MKLVDMTLKDYLQVLQSDAPAPGGGSVSALAGAEGAGLLAMVCDLTTSKAKYEQDHALCAQVRGEAETIFTGLRDAIDEDTEAFNLVAAAFKLPKETDEEKAARRQAIAAGTLEATRVPYHVMELAREGLALAERLQGHYNSNCDSDFGVAVLNLITCLRGAWLNVKINLPGVKDEGLAEDYAQGGRRMIEEGEAIAQRLYKEIEEAL